MPKVSQLRESDSARARGGRPAVLTREKVLDAARKLSSHELTMNAVAELLGVKKASLYYHFSSRQDLLVALGSEVVRDLVVPPPDSANWRSWLEQAVTALYEMLCANPVFLDIENLNQIARAGLPLQEAALEVLEGAGFAPGDAVNVWRVTTSHAYVAATNAHEARHTDIDRLAREMDQLLVEAERNRPMPHVRALLEKGKTDARQGFADTLAWQLRNLPDPKSLKPAPRASRKKS